MWVLGDTCRSASVTVARKVRATLKGSVLEDDVWKTEVTSALATFLDVLPRELRVAIAEDREFVAAWNGGFDALVDLAEVVERRGATSAALGGAARGAVGGDAPTTLATRLAALTAYDAAMGQKAVAFGLYPAMNPAPKALLCYNCGGAGHRMAACPVMKSSTPGDE